MRRGLSIFRKFRCSGWLEYELTGVADAMEVLRKQIERW